MSRRRVDPAANRLAKRLERAADIIPDIRTHLNTQRSQLTILTTASNTGRQTGSHTDPTGRAVLELAHIDYREGLIDDALASIRIGCNLLDEACRTAAGHRTPDVTVTDDPTCYIAGCTDPVGSYLLKNGEVRFRMGGEHGGMCDRHRIAANRGTMEHDETAGQTKGSP